MRISCLPPCFAAVSDIPYKVPPTDNPAHALFWQTYDILRKAAESAHFPDPGLRSRRGTADFNQQLAPTTVCRATLRQEHNLSQRRLATLLQLQGLDVDKNVITRIETGKRHVTDIEINELCRLFNVSFEDLIRQRKKEP